MNLALLLLLPASAATDLTPPPSAARAVTTYDAIATEQTPAVKELVKPAVFIGDGAKSPIIGSAAPGSIA
jgi:hypothetical protein